MEELLTKYKVRIREFEVEVGRGKVICRDVVPKEELLKKVEEYGIIVHLYPDYFSLGSLSILSSQDFLIDNFDKIIKIANLLEGKRTVVFYGKDLDLLEFIISHTSINKLRVVEKNGWVTVNSLSINLACGEATLLSSLMYLYDVFKPLIIGSCELANFAQFLLNRGVVVLLSDRVFIDGNVISPPDVKIISFISTKFLKNRYIIRNPKVDVISAINELENKYSSRKIIIENTEVKII